MPIIKNHPKIAQKSKKYHVLKPFCNLLRRNYFPVASTKLKKHNILCFECTQNTTSCVGFDKWEKSGRKIPESL